MITKNNPKVAILVVTYNRLTDLKKCINSIREQSYKHFDIVVVNNGSTDGTKDFLDQQNDIICIHQDNVGGAGGFYTGMKYMYENKYEWLLMMDDDGITHANELENLLLAYNDFLNEKNDVILNALVVNKDLKEELAFSWFKDRSRSIKVDEIKKEKYIPEIHPFNGTLVKWSIIDKIGLIKKEMFIWGDEQEYTFRAKFNGINTYTVTSSIHFHPKEKGIKKYPVPFLKIFPLAVKPSKMSHHYYRNVGYLSARYEGYRLGGYGFLLSHTLFFIRTLQFSELKKLYKYFFRGRRNIF